MIPLNAQQTNGGNVTQVPLKRRTIENMKLILHAARGWPTSNKVRHSSSNKYKQWAEAQMFAEQLIASNAAHKLVQVYAVSNANLRLSTATIM